MVYNKYSYGLQSEAIAMKSKKEEFLDHLDGVDEYIHETRYDIHKNYIDDFENLVNEFDDIIFNCSNKIDKIIDKLINIKEK